MNATPRDYLQLHFIVLLWGTTAVFGKLISIPAVEMIFFRMGLATLGMAALMVFTRQRFTIGTREIATLLLTGTLLGAHSIAFFAAGQISTASVGLIGFATCSLWTALLEPLTYRKKIDRIEITLGLVVIAGLYIIFSFDFQFFTGLWLGILSGLLLAIFSIINAHLVKRIHPTTITFYEMAGGFLITALFLPVYQVTWATEGELQLAPTPADWVYIAILALVCSVYAYSVSVELMKRIPVFVIQLSMNLEPIYGMGMAALVLEESKYFTSSFLVGSFVILAAVMLYPVTKAWQKRKLQASKNET